ncbi:hypothetical protein [Prosthecobacter sp.]|uniref:hypothetical protein n=1 Tax=Prosthecobacter sp. TaxID=1965333 RepID=UPI0037836197
MNETLLPPGELEAVRRKFGHSLLRQETLALIQIFVASEAKARTYIEGPDACLKPLPKQKPTDWNRWSRDHILAELNPIHR